MRRRTSSRCCFTAFWWYVSGTPLPPLACLHCTYCTDCTQRRRRSRGAEGGERTKACLPLPFSVEPCWRQRLLPPPNYWQNSSGFLLAAVVNSHVWAKKVVNCVEFFFLQTCWLCPVFGKWRYGSRHLEFTPRAPKSQDR